MLEWLLGACPLNSDCLSATRMQPSVL